MQLLKKKFIRNNLHITFIEPFFYQIRNIKKKLLISNKFNRN